MDAELLVSGRLRWTSDDDAARREALALVSSLGLGDRVEFLGAYTQARAPEIFPPRRYCPPHQVQRPMSTVVIEALSCGRPVVYSKSGGVPELVGDQAGIGIDTALSWEQDIAPDPKALADAVCRVHGDLTTFSGAARARAVDRFDVQRWLARHQAVFEQLVH